MRSIILPFLHVEETVQARIVPPSGFTARLTLLTAAAMAFLALFALALSLATGRLATRWDDALASASTVRISAPAEQIDAQVSAVLRVLETTPGVVSARALSIEEERELLAPWFGTSLPVDELPLPALIEIVEDEGGYDAESLRLRLAGEAPGAVLDDHARWRRPLVEAASRLRLLGLVSIAIITGVTAAMITLAAQAALAANSGVIRTLRLIGATDRYIERAFVKRFTMRAFAGALIGTFLASAAVAMLPEAQEAGGFLTGLSMRGAEWIWALAIPPLAALVAYFATRIAAHRSLTRLM
ncbi:cell division protein FtsX [Celeribacter arenosi]|uniref:FtsX-like permease family protein n=1 Tax=Celeribacter arenosi TaxID=792649 RepID=A0ABP7K276_9RHOB